MPNYTDPFTKEDRELLSEISGNVSALSEFRPESDDSSYEPIVKFATELQTQLEEL